MRRNKFYQYQSVHQYAKANTKHMKDDDRTNESSHIQYLNVNNLY